MSLIYKVIAPDDMELMEVQYIKIPGNMADVWMRKNIRKETMDNAPVNEDGSVNTYQVSCADEIYFRVDSEKVSEQDIKDNFEKYWVYGLKWKDRSLMEDKEKIEELEAENKSLKQCIVELSNLL